MIELKGLTIEELLQLNTRNMSTKELSKLVTRIGNTVNRRIKNLEKSESREFSVALTNIKASGGKIIAKGKDRKDLQAEVQRARNFINSKTSTVKGAKQYHKLLKKISGKNIKNFGDIDANKHNKFITVLNHLKEHDASFFESTLKYKEIVGELSGKLDLDVDDLQNAMFKKMREINEREQEILNEMETNPFEL